MHAFHYRCRPRLRRQRRPVIRCPACVRERCNRPGSWRHSRWLDWISEWGQGRSTRASMRYRRLPRITSGFGPPHAADMCPLQQSKPYPSCVPGLQEQAQRRELPRTEPRRWGIFRDAKTLASGARYRLWISCLASLSWVVPRRSGCSHAPSISFIKRMV